MAIEFLHELGIVVDLAPDGAVALAKASQSDYDIILMDMQMPVMDGLAATRAIRKLARCQKVPIVAMTANALSSDRERCIEAGMNDHLAKPIAPDELLAKLAYWVKLQPGLVRPPVPEIGVEPRVVAVHGLADIPGLDSALGLRQVLGREALYASLLRKFVSGHGRLLERLEQALRQENWVLLEREAHTLKGVSAQIGAGEVRQVAETLERAVHFREPRPRIDALLADLGRLLPPLVQAIAACPASRSLMRPPPTSMSRCCTRSASICCASWTAATLPANRR